MLVNASCLQLLAVSYWWFEAFGFLGEAALFQLEVVFWKEVSLLCGEKKAKSGIDESVLRGKN